MDKKTFKLLLGFNLIKIGSFLLKNGNKTAYMVSYHNVENIENVNQILAELFVKKYQTTLKEYNLHFIGLSNSGRDLAQKIHARSLIINPKNKLSITNPKTFSKSDILELDASYCHYIVDNAVTTGDTLMGIIPKLNAINIISLSGCFYIFNRQEDVVNVTDCPIFSIFDYSEIAEYLSECINQ